MLHMEGPLLTVDVSTRSVEETDIDSILEQFVGGRGLNVRLAHERIPFDADPFGPENSLFFSTGPLQASDMSFTGRTAATSVSPLTNGLASSNAGGFVSRPLQDTGYASIEITGQSDELVTVHVSDEGVDVTERPDLEGATVPEVADALSEDGYGPESQIAIGPAGENQVRYASMMTFEHRAFGRGGLGAVLGSKNVKAVTFEGDSAPDIEVSDVAKEVTREAATEDHVLKRQGTAFETEWVNDELSLPTKYWERMDFDEGVEGISGDRVEERKYEKATCSKCAFACKLPTRDEESGVETEGPEFETVFAFGSNPMVDDIVSVMKSNDLCDKYGLDTISAGVSITAYLKANDEFGNSELIHELIEKIAHREGEGDMLAEGVDRFADELGVKNWTVKGLEFPAHDGRVSHGLALSYCTANRGADHMYSAMNIYDYFQADDPSTLEGKPDILPEVENQKAVNDTAVFCRFSRNNVLETWDGEDHRDRYTALMDASYEDLMDLGSRIVELERHFNNQRGFDRDADMVPYEIEGIEAGLDRYYELRGWNQDGTVPEENVAAYT
ncbi:aldehyde ferredoxin oxidoreductase C-terminal domain-containing protein [Haloarculaceae archaeon H-GB1-1]|nr:aldehyde ferredoxin oxidoreductase C-terminal domain-containing protein [Haloarculaceae archaeon H-GB1-1]